MLSEVIKLTNGNFKDLIKEYQVVLYSYPCHREVKETFSSKQQAEEYVKQQETLNGLDIYSTLNVEGVKYE